MTKITSEKEFELRNLLSKKESITKIAKKLGVSRQAVYKFIVNNGLPYGSNNFRLTVTETYKGIPYKIYCSQYHINPERVRDLMKYQDKTLEEAIEFLMKERSKYQINGIPAWDIAKRNGVKLSTFWGRIRKGKSLEEAVLPTTYHHEGGYKKSINKLIKGVNEADENCFQLLSFVLRDMEKNVKIQYKTIKDVREYINNITHKSCNPKNLMHFWDYYKKDSSFNIGYVWSNYTKILDNRRLWKLGEFSED